ncbi:MAG: flagellar basal body L-ring protein FlgH [Calditrichaeota bacterium]|nr:flagellar basal body L-ring protein FlgH [Calditrichota bacterium]
MKRLLPLLSPLYIIILMIPVPSQCQAQQVYASSLFTDHRAKQVGDVVTILIVEYSSAQSEANSKSSKISDHSFSSTGGAKSLAYMPLYGLKGQFKNGFDNGASTSRKGSLTGKITATITKVNENGNLVIDGLREVTVNGEKEKIGISGTVRPEDVRSDNTVYSYNVANARILYQGKGLVDKGQRAGILDKLLGWIF